MLYVVKAEMKDRYMWKVPKIVKLILITVMCTCVLTSCKQNPQGENGANIPQGPEYAYVPEFTTLTSGENEKVFAPFFEQDKLYYFLSRAEAEDQKKNYYFVCRDLQEPKQVKEYFLTPPVQEGEALVQKGKVDAEGNLYAVWSVTSETESEEGDSALWLVKYDEDGMQVYAKSLEEVLPEGEEIVWRMMVTPQGELLAVSLDSFYWFDKDGELEKVLSVRDGFTFEMWMNADGEILYTFEDAQKGLGIAKVPIPKETGNGETAAEEMYCTGFPDDRMYVRDIDGERLLIAGSTKVYEYNIKTREFVTLFAWLDCNLNGTDVQNISMDAEGNILAYYNESGRGTEYIVLKKTPASEVPQKEIITLATWYGYQYQQMEQAVLEFNRTNTRYQIVIKNYKEDTSVSFDDAKALLYADILSDNPPDIIELTNLDVADLAEKGVFEDLTPYLERSNIVSREDFVESVLNAYFLEGRQVTVPLQFTIHTLLGKSSEVGKMPGWTLEDVLTYAKEHPEAKLIDYITKEGALEVCIRYNSAHFVDFETGECHFDSPEFIQVLQFANQFPAEVNYNEERKTASLIREGQVLLAEAYISDVESYQIYLNGFGEDITSIGYPTVDGSPGVYLTGDVMYGICATGDCKEGAWSFVESILGEEETFVFYLPARKDLLEEMFVTAMNTEKTGIWGYDGWQTQLDKATPDEVEAVKEIIDMARLETYANELIFDMIKEEAGAYFSGQKTAEEVAKIIQSRVEIYVNENR